MSCSLQYKIKEENLGQRSVTSCFPCDDRLCMAFSEKGKAGRFLLITCFPVIFVVDTCIDILYNPINET